MFRMPWMQIGTYRTFPLPILPILPPIRNRRSAKVAPAKFVPAVSTAPLE